MSDEKVRALLREIERELEGGDLTLRDYAVEIFGFPRNPLGAWRALENHPIVKEVVDLVHHERDKWLADLLRDLARHVQEVEEHAEPSIRAEPHLCRELEALARRILESDFPDFFEEWAATNEALIWSAIAARQSSPGSGS